MVTGVVRVSMRTVDILLVGRVVGAAAVAGLGIADAVARLVLKLAQGLGAGTVALVSQHLGAARRQEADVAATQSLALGLLFGAPVGAIGWVLAPAIFGLVGASSEVAGFGVRLPPDRAPESAVPHARHAGRTCPPGGGRHAHADARAGRRHRGQRDPDRPARPRCGCPAASSA